MSDGYSTDERRARLVQGLRTLATFLEGRHELPVPYDVTATVSVLSGSDAEKRAEVERIARLIGSTLDPAAMAYGHHRTGLAFGPVQYQALAVTAARRAQHEAWLSYVDSVVPDSPAGG